MRKKILALCGVVAFGLFGVMMLTAPAQAQDMVVFNEAGPVDLSGSEPGGHVNIGKLVTVGTVTLSPGEWTINASAVLTVENPDNKHVGFCTLYVRDGRPDAQSDPPNPNQVGRTAGAGGSSSIWDKPDDSDHRHAKLELEQFPDFTTPIMVTITENETVVDMVCAVNDNRPAEYDIYATDIAIEATRTPDPAPTATVSAVPTIDPVTCDEFTTQDDAQVAYQAGATQLDGNGDGVACGSLPVADQDQLPATGSPLVWMVVTGAVLLLAGGTMFALSRLRWRQTQQ